MQVHNFIFDEKKVVDFKSLVVWLKQMSNQVFQLSFVESRQLQKLASLTIKQAQHMNPVDYKQYCYLSFKKWFLGDPFGWVPGDRYP